MIQIWGIPVIASIEEIVLQLRAELAQQNIQLLENIKMSPNNLMVSCISHADGAERRPSCGISTDESYGRKGKVYPAGMVNCFTCGYKADFPTFISNCFGHNDQGYLGFKWLTENFVSLEIENRPPLNIDLGEKEVQLDEEVYVTEEELQKYRFIHPYMYKRKLTDRVIEYFDVGYDAETSSLTFPVHDLQGIVRFIQRRHVHSKFFNNPEGAYKGRLLYGAYRANMNVQNSEEIWVCESIIDALTVWGQLGIPAVALMQALPTIEQLELIEQLPKRKIVLALDNDEAGRKGEKKIQAGVKTKLLYKFQFPHTFKDVNSLSQDILKSYSKYIHLM